MVLDPVKMSGLATPKNMRDHRFELLGMPAARERAVILFPRSCLGLGQPFTRVRSVLVTKARIVVSVAESMNETNDNQIVYEMDHSLNVVNVEPGNGVWRPDHPFDSEKECHAIEG